MEEKKEFLTEENYERAKKKLMKLTLIIFLGGILLGGSLIITGIVKTNEAKKQNNQQEQQEQVNTTRSTTEIQADIDKVQAEIDDLEYESGKIFRDEGSSDNYYEKQKEMSAKERELAKLEDELLDVTKKENDEIFNKAVGKAKQAVSTYKYVPLLIIGSSIISFCSMVALIVYIFGKRRELAAFTTQQVMPIAQEGIEKMTPTVGKATGTIAKEISKGIKEGLNDKDKDSK